MGQRPPGDVKIIADMREQVGIDVLEHPGAHKIGLGRDQFLGHARPQHDAALDAVLLHHLLGGDGGDDHHRHAAVMAFAMARRARYQRLGTRHTRRLRKAQQSIDITAQRNHRPAFAPGRGEGGGDASHTARHLEAVFLQDSSQIGAGLHLLKTRLGKAEDLIDHGGEFAGASVDQSGCFGLQRGRRRSFHCRMRGHGQNAGGKQITDHRRSP